MPSDSSRSRVDLSVWWDDARSGRLPMVCVGSGQPADRLQRFHEVSPPLTIWLMVVILPLAVLNLGWMPRGAGPMKLPVSAAWSRRLRRRTFIAVTAFILTMALLVVAAMWNRSAIVVLPIAAAAAAVSLVLSFWREALQPRKSSRLRTDKTAPYYIELRNVHPAFAEAYEAQTMSLP